MNAHRSGSAATICEWFALCTRPADGVVWHPGLGHVPTCLPCADRLDLEIQADDDDLAG